MSCSVLLASPVQQTCSIFIGCHVGLRGSLEATKSITVKTPTRWPEDVLQCTRRNTHCRSCKCMSPSIQTRALPRDSTARTEILIILNEWVLRSFIWVSHLCLSLPPSCLRHCPEAPHMGSNPCSHLETKKMEQIWERQWKTTTANTAPVNMSSMGM